MQGVFLFGKVKKINMRKVNKETIPIGTAYETKSNDLQKIGKRKSSKSSS
jgi:hypothetical protein